MHTAQLNTVLVFIYYYASTNLQNWQKLNLQMFSLPMPLSLPTSNFLLNQNRPPYAASVLVTRAHARVYNSVLISCTAEVHEQSRCCVLQMYRIVLYTPPTAPAQIAWAELFQGQPNTCSHWKIARVVVRSHQRQLEVIRRNTSRKYRVDTE